MDFRTTGVMAQGAWLTLAIAGVALLEPLNGALAQDNAAMSEAAPDAGGDQTDWLALSSVRLSLKNRRQLSSFKGETLSATSDKAVEAPLTDMLLDLTRIDGRIAEALKAKDGEKVSGNYDIAFNAKVYAVAGGRIYSEGAAQCGPFIKDVSVCQIECDGGGFAIRRKAVEQGYAMTLIAGKGATGDDKVREDFGLSDCGEGDSITIGTKQQGSTAEIDFARDY